MKRNWELDELIESWTLLPHELALLDSKIGANRLGFAVLLKFFELALKFPSSSQDVPWEVVSYIAKQVNLPAQEYFNYDWNGRSMMRHRGEIRRWLGIRTCSSDDVQANSNFSLFYYLNSEPGRATLDSFLSEISKLEHLRKIGLSNDLSDD